MTGRRAKTTKRGLRGSAPSVDYMGLSEEALDEFGASCPRHRGG